MLNQPFTFYSEFVCMYTDPAPLPERTGIEFNNPVRLLINRSVPSNNEGTVEIFSMEHGNQCVTTTGASVTLESCTECLVLWTLSELTPGELEEAYLWV